MRAVILMNSRLALPALNHLVSVNRLAGIVLPDSKHEANEAAESIASANKLPVCTVSRTSIGADLGPFLRDCAADVACILTFPLRIPCELFDVPPHGFINFHVGLLPSNRGPDPIFWAIRNGASAGGISVHKVTEDLDAGPLLRVERVPIVPGETWGIHATKLSLACIELCTEILDTLPSTSPADWREQKESSAKYRKRPGPADLTINWANPADQIERLVNACNPNYRGAATFLQGTPVRILEVSAADLGQVPGGRAGEIVHADPQNGLFVRVGKRQYLRINIVEMPDGVLTGFKLAALGVQAGERFSMTAS